MSSPARSADHDRTANRRDIKGPTPRSEEESDGTDPDDMSVEDWVAAENSRPTLPDETADGLDDMDEEVRHQAEDRPLDTPGRIG